ncbi:ribosome small subunit-dependent GTPase A [Mycoplasmopsis pullorum]|uniref:ribosome small subunit-dependent GTPase A n=1 Tax=Mycoplasmopsis pullorum TaxID=48003 RepID=UPI0011195CF7|nr:ribosome small subunit-dependent GTPase A [Mycoplasmopsis pullorum]TNK83308.1 ribosome small subunit-dependent GTPase A [Mycoplasmopsis pullorum]TNK92128.1 ribosome small subunit-dependent GTPase A [Mycoplasmopsis pullorum]
MEYKVYSINSGIYTLHNERETIKVPAAGRLRFKENSPLVGDYVKLHEGLLTQICERKNSFIRPKVANVDQVFIVMSLVEPDFQSFLMDKFLAIIENKEITPIILFTKSDLTNDFYWFDEYTKLGYSTFLVDNKKPIFIEKIKKLFKDRTSVFMGQTGVGKTSTINNLGGYQFQTQQISKALGRGKHTTRIVQIVKFNDGELIDTPGFSSLDLDLDKIDLAQSFKFFKLNIGKCKFRSCLHINERIQDCFIKQSVENGDFPLWRYQNYQKLQTEVKKEEY